MDDPRTDQRAYKEFSIGRFPTPQEKIQTAIIGVAMLAVAIWTAVFLMS